MPEYPKNYLLLPEQHGKIRVSLTQVINQTCSKKQLLYYQHNSGRETIRIKAMVTADPVKQQQRRAAQAARLQQNN